MIPKSFEEWRESLKNWFSSFRWKVKTFANRIRPGKVEEIIMKKVRSKSFSMKTEDENKEKIYTSYWDWRAEESLPIDFFKNTSLHGLKYIGERRQHFIERIFWGIAFLIGLIMSYYMISDVWRKYKSNSVIITFQPYETKIEEIPFPAITICNMNKVLRSKAEMIIKKANRSRKSEKTQNAKENLYYLNHVCSASKSFSRTFNYSVNRGKIDEKVLDMTNEDEGKYEGDKEDLWKFLEKASESCENMIPLCMWEGIAVTPNCSNLFKPIETDYGFCCVFNMIPPSILHRVNANSTSQNKDEDQDAVEEWKWDGDSLLKKKDRNSEFPKYPSRQKLAGKSFGLSFLLNPILDEYFCTVSDSIGFRLVAHLPIDVPHVADFGSAVSPNSEVFINVVPEVTIADKENIGSFTQVQRKCYFSGEHELAYYKYYTATNCIDECIANLTLEECKCARHYMPRDDSTPLCGPKQFSCASKIKTKLAGQGHINNKNCDKCYPTCTEISYHTETTHTPMQDPRIVWATTKWNGSGTVLAKWAHENVSIIHVYFGADSTNAKTRKELYSAVDLIANFGGLMGLCLGFSGLSLVEVIYFLTLRVWFRKNRNKKNKSSSGNTEALIPKPEVSRPNSAPQAETTKMEMFNRRHRDLNHILYTVTIAPDLGSLRPSGCLQLGCTDLPENNITSLESPKKKDYSVLT